MPDILVKTRKKAPHFAFDVTVKESDSTSTHEVTMKTSFYSSLGTNTTPEEVVEKSFEFLLEREPKESILDRFDIEIIASYFPEYKEKVKSF